MTSPSSRRFPYGFLVDLAYAANRDPDELPEYLRGEIARRATFASEANPYFAVTDAPCS